MKTAKYWEQRFTQLEAAQNRMGAAAAAEIQKEYDKAQRDISDKIKLWYQRFADNNGITMAEAKQWLKGKDLEEFKWDVWEYIRRGEENAVDQSWAKELENASARWHISRYEALKIRMRESLEELTQKYQMSMDDAMSEVYRSGYYHTAFEVAKGIGVGYDIAAIDQSALEKVLSKPWAVDSVNFSERIWSNKQKLIDVAYRELTQGIMLGRDPQKTIDAIAKQMNASKSQVGRLVMTEEAYFASASRKDCFNDLGVEKYVIVATLDNRTSEICQEMDGKVFKMSDYQPGTTAPPFHVNCRSTTAPYFEDMQAIVERAARDENGKAYDVPGSMAYKEWKDRFVMSESLGQHKGNKVQITDQAISKVREIDINGLDQSNNAYIQKTHKELLEFAQKENDSNEVATIVDLSSNKRTPFVKGTRHEVDIYADTDMYHLLAVSGKGTLILCHNHPGLTDFSANDLSIFMRHDAIKTMTIVTNRGNVKYISRDKNFDSDAATELMRKCMKENNEDIAASVEKFLKKCYSVGIKRH